MIYSAIANKKKKKKMENLQQNWPERFWEKIRAHHSHRELKMHPPPKRFGQQKLNIYDSRTDLGDHVRHYKQEMSYWRNEKALMCRMLLASLRDITLRWFDKLPPSRINSFES